MIYQAVVSGLGEHIHFPMEADNEQQAYEKTRAYAENHLPSVLIKHIQVTPLTPGEQAKDDRAELKFQVGGKGEEV